MRRYGWLFAGLLLIAGVLAFVLSRPEPEAAPVALPALPVAPPRVIGSWTPQSAVEVELSVLVTEHGQPVSGAEVSVNGKPPSTTDSIGRVTFRLPPGAVELSASAHGVTARAAATLSPLLGPSKVELSLDARGMIDVTVTDAETRLPLQGALVEVHLSPTEPRRVLAAIQTDAQGKAKLDGLVPNEYLLSVTRDGYMSEACTFVKVGTTREVQLFAHEPRTGRVLLPDGKPAAGATVVSIPSGWEKSSTATTAADGTFTLPFASRSGQLCAQLGSLVVTGTVELANAAGLVLAAPRHFVGSVMDEDGVPLEGARVRSEQGALEVVSMSSADGGFAIDSLCGSFAYATFEREGFISEGVGLEEEAPTHVVLSRPRAVRGVIVDDENKPVGGAIVKLREPELITVSDAEGRFGFEGVKAEVNLTAEEGERGGFAETMVEAGKLVEVTISIGPPLFVVPVEVLLDGKPAPNVWELEAKRIGGRPWETKTHWHANGRVIDVIYATSLELPVGSFTISAKNEDGHGETELRVTGKTPQEPLRIHATLNPLPPPPPTRPLKVRVVDARGVPVPDAGVHCVAQTWGYARTDEDGRGACAMTDLSELPIVVKTRVGGAVASVEPKDWNAEQLLQLKDAVTIRGKVIGELPGPSSILVNSKEENISSPFTPPEFVLPDKPAVRTILCVWSESAERGCTVAQPPESGELEVTIPVGPPGQISFSVSDARGQPVAQPVLYVDRFSARPPVDGGVVMLGLSPGQHLLIVNVNGGPERYETILNVEPGKAQHLGRIELK